MSQVKVTFDNIVVRNNGDPSGKGKVYWLFQADGRTVSERSVNNPRKTADGETISIGQSRQLTMNQGQTLTVFGSVSEKDSLDKDETDSFQLNFTAADSWGAGSFHQTLVDRKLDVTVNGHIDIV